MRSAHTHPLTQSVVLRHLANRQSDACSYHGFALGAGERSQGQRATTLDRSRLGRLPSETVSLNSCCVAVQTHRRCAREADLDGSRHRPGTRAPRWLVRSDRSELRSEHPAEPLGVRRSRDRSDLGFSGGPDPAGRAGSLRVDPRRARGGRATAGRADHQAGFAACATGAETPYTPVCRVWNGRGAADGCAVVVPVSSAEAMARTPSSSRAQGSRDDRDRRRTHH
jgi:hypothetical protein